MNTTLRIKLLQQQQEEIEKKISINDEYIRLFEIDNKDLLLNWIKNKSEIHKLKNKL